MTTDSPKPSAAARSPGLFTLVWMLELILSGPLPGIGIRAAQVAEVYRVPVGEIERIFVKP